MTAGSSNPLSVLRADMRRSPMAPRDPGGILPYVELMKAIRCLSASAASDDEVDAESGELPTSSVGLFREGWFCANIPECAADRPKEKFSPLALIVDSGTGEDISTTEGGVWEGLGCALVWMWIIGWLER